MGNARETIRGTVEQGSGKVSEQMKEQTREQDREKGQGTR